METKIGDVRFRGEKFFIDVLKHSGGHDLKIDI